MAKNSSKPWGYWNNIENIKKEILHRQENNLSLKIPDVKREFPSLYRVARENFGSWKEALESVDIDFDSIRINQNWTKDQIAKILTERKDKGLSLSPYDVYENVPKLQGACKRVFGGYRQAIEYCGFAYEDAVKRKYWSREKVIYALNNRLFNEESLIPKKVEAENSSLYSACTTHFGSYKSAIEYCGLNYDAIIIKKWSKEIIIKVIKYKYENKLPMRVIDLWKNDTSLYGAINYYFKDYKAALKECGIKIEEIYKQKEWSLNKITDSLIDRYISGLPMNIGNIVHDDPSLYGACLDYFGDYKSAIESTGINYDTIKQDRHKLKFLGNKFEVLLGEILNELQFKYSKGFNFELRPDFTLPHKRWIDAKLSFYTVYNSETIQKYEPHCNQLTIVFLRGDRNTDKMLTKKTRIISVYKLIKQLPIKLQKQYIQKSEDIWMKADNLETVGVV